MAANSGEHAVALRGSPQARLAPQGDGAPVLRHDAGQIRRTMETHMSITIGHLAPVVALIAGILILIMPRLLNYIVAIYLIVIGIIGLGIFK